MVVLFFRATFLLSFTFFLVPSVPVVAKEKPLPDKVWVVIRPIQCLGNLWEKEWLGKHNNQGIKYPQNHEFDVMRSFFKQKDVQILQLRDKPYMQGEALSTACNAPRGDTLFLLIQAEDVRKMVNLGYTERLPAKDVPPNK